ncbi:MAG: enoyl-CoA hydratase-related protein [Actinomycetota bacterium]|nr:enoyl-CoA hydratase-related protein [Actinomycetota bacterium]
MEDPPGTGSPRADAGPGRPALPEAGMTAAASGTPGTSSGPLVRRQDRTGAAVLVLDSPANRNALSKRLVAEMRAHLADAAADPAVRAVAITGTGNTFCSGADLSDPPVQQGSGSFGDLLLNLWDYPKPVVVAVNGHVRAGGFGLLASADVSVCVETATFSFSEVRLGLVPALISVLCLRRMTPSSASRYLLTGEVFDPAAALQSGLVGSVVPTGALDGALAEVLDLFQQCEPEALRVTRDLMRRIPLMDVAAGLDHAAGVSASFFGTDAAAEGIAAFREKRPPRWAG